MAHRLIDLSVPPRGDIASNPPDMLPKTECIDCHQSAPRIVHA